jgi:hypothetical protein
VKAWWKFSSPMDSLNELYKDLEERTDGRIKCADCRYRFLYSPFLLVWKHLPFFSPCSSPIGAYLSQIGLYYLVVRIKKIQNSGFHLSGVTWPILIWRDGYVNGYHPGGKSKNFPMIVN